ncbi:MAG: hypothetical protein K2I00_00830 [Ruminococcus sp.]|nr:hypothetical protein [Ruminococcus sp.]
MYENEKDAQTLIDALEQLGLVKTDEEEEPKTDSTHPTGEDKEAIFGMLLGGYAKTAPISFMFLGYSAGFTHGMEAMSKVTEADEAK